MPSVQQSIGSSSGRSSGSSRSVSASSSRSKQWQDFLEGQENLISGLSRSYFSLPQREGGVSEYLSPIAGIEGPPAPYPAITTGKIWNDQQIQERVNAMRGSEQAGSEGDVRRLRKGLSSRGFGGNSPLYQALAQNRQAQARSSMTSGENDLRWNAAQGNAEHLLRSEQSNLLRSQIMNDDNFRRAQANAANILTAYNTAHDSRLRAYLANIQRGNALLGALSAYLSPLSYSDSRSDSISISSSNQDSSNDSYDSGYAASW